MFRLIKKIGRMFLFGFARALRSYEEALFQATMEVLAPEDRRIFELQVNARERIQRWNKDRMVIFGFEDRDRLPKLSVTDSDHCLARFSIKGEAGSISVSVMVHKGVLSSFEFSRSPSGLTQKPVAVRRICSRPGHWGYSRQIDAQES